jgi:hypothetical protein
LFVCPTQVHRHFHPTQIKAQSTIPAQHKTFLQGAVELLGDVLDRVGDDGRDDAVRHGPPVRWAGDDGVGLAHRRRLHPRRGRDLLRLPHLRRPLLLERQALQPAAVGALRLLAHRLVRIHYTTLILVFSPISLLLIMLVSSRN